MMHIEPFFAAGFMAALKQFVTVTKLHPILVNFTAALVPVSVGCDLVARLRKDESFRTTAWWTLFFATVITPFTAIAGWLFWMDDDNGVAGMTIHKWLGTALVAILFCLFVWRRSLYRQKRWATAAYLIFGLMVLIALVAQGYLGGQQVFSDM